jgi:hypothetical protein
VKQQLFLKVKTGIKAGESCSMPDRAYNDGYNEGRDRGRKGDWSWYKDHPNARKP